MIKKTDEKTNPNKGVVTGRAIAVYIVNYIIIIALFFFFIFLNYQDDLVGLISYISNASYIVQFSVLFLIMVALFALYFYCEQKDYLKNPVNSGMLFLIIEVSLIICFVFGKYVNFYLRPIALAGILTLFLSNRKTAIFVNLFFSIMVLLVDLLVSPNGTVLDLSTYLTLIVGFSSGMIGILIFSDVCSRWELLLKSFIVSVPTVICTAIPLISYGNENLVTSMIGSVFSGPLSVASLIILMPVFEIVFGRITSFKLAELTDHKAPLIKRLINEAPGTFNHAITVSNIAESCAIAVGEDGLMARACAYYHDIGKLRRPEFFKENQVDGANPHDDLTPELSANIIKAHATDGYALCVKQGLPKEIAEVCRQHHGTMPILYFYDKAKKFTDGDVDISQFCYQGVKPQTKISAIIMIADGAEAASRSLKDRSRENVKKVVRKIVNDRMELGQFDECEITIKELNIIMNTVVNNLTGIYHKRVEYPKVSLDGLKNALEEESAHQSENQTVETENVENKVNENDIKSKEVKEEVKEKTATEENGQPLSEVKKAEVKAKENETSKNETVKKETPKKQTSKKPAVKKEEAKEPAETKETSVKPTGEKPAVKKEEAKKPAKKSVKKESTVKTEKKPTGKAVNKVKSEESKAKEEK